MYSLSSLFVNLGEGDNSWHWVVYQFRSVNPYLNTVKKGTDVMCILGFLFKIDRHSSHISENLPILFINKANSSLNSAINVEQGNTVGGKETLDQATESETAFTPTIKHPTRIPTSTTITYMQRT